MAWNVRNCLLQLHQSLKCQYVCSPVNVLIHKRNCTVWTRHSQCLQGSPHLRDRPNIMVHGIEKPLAQTKTTWTSVDFDDPEIKKDLVVENRLDKCDSGNKKQEVHYDLKGPFIKYLLSDSVEKIRQKTSPGVGLTTADWEEIEQSLSSNELLARNWPSRLMSIMANKNNHDNHDHVHCAFEVFDVSKSLVNFVRERGMKVTLTMLGSLIYICGQQQGSKNQQELIYRTFDEIQELTDVYDPMTAKYVISALSQTERWQECVSLIDMVRLVTVPSTRYYSPILCAAINANNQQVMWEIMDTLWNECLVPEDQVMHAVLAKYRTEPDQVFEVLNVYRKYGWIPSEAVAKAIAQWFKSDKQSSWTVTATTTNASGICQSCQKQLEPSWPLNAEEFEQLRTEFLEKSLKKNDVFLNTSPKELRNFEKFLTRNGPFDVVIDYLNVYYRGQVHVGRVLKYFSEKLEKKVLVLGRHHIKYKLSHQGLPNTDQVQWFYTSDSSSDDTFMLYAALHSGSNTLIITRDHLRDHSFLLGTKMANLFHQWQRAHQVDYKGVDTSKEGQKKLRFKWPNRHETRIQVNSSGWHIPYESGGDRASYELPDTWMCIRR